MPEPNVIDVAPAVKSGLCRRCRSECCNCAGCIGRKGGQVDVCNRCYQKEQKGADPR